METKIVYEVKELLEMFPFSKAHWYRKINKGTVPCVQIGNRKAVCGWFIEEQIGKATVQNQEGTSNEDAIHPSS